MSGIGVKAQILVEPRVLRPRTLPLRTVQEGGWLAVGGHQPVGNRRSGLGGRNLPTGISAHPGSADSGKDRRLRQRRSPL